MPKKGSFAEPYEQNVPLPQYKDLFVAVNQDYILSQMFYSCFGSFLTILCNFPIYFCETWWVPQLGSSSDMAKTKMNYVTLAHLEIEITVFKIKCPKAPLQHTGHTVLEIGKTVESNEEKFVNR